MSKFPCRGAVGGEDGGAVAIAIIVDQGNGVVQGINFEAANHGSKYLFIVAFHIRLCCVNGWFSSGGSGSGDSGSEVVVS